MENTRYRILLVEDGKLDQMAFKRLVEDENLPYDYTIAGSVSEAHSILSSEQFDIVIADYSLGDGTGFDILDSVKDTPIIFVTGTGSEEIAIKAWKAGAYDYLIKDVERNYLKAVPITIENAVKHKRTEARLRLLSGAVMSTDDSVYITDMENKITFVNRAFCETYGYREKEIIGKDSDILWTGKPQSENRRSVSQVAESAFEVGFYHERKDGSVFPVSLSRSIIKDENGNEVAVVAVARDISEHILIEERLRAANRKLKRRNQLRSELTIMVSEKLRTLLAAEHIDRVKGIISDFLDISKIDAGKIRLKLTEFSLRSVVSEVVEVLSPFAAEKNIDLESFVPDSKLVVNADYDRIVQVLTNLINNAIKSAPSNDCINVRVEDSGNQITVEVQDDGPSIGRDEIDKIFNLSAQTKRQLCSDKEDLALGLPIAKQLVEMHGGCIWAESGDERGNSFCFTLPKSGIQEETASAVVKERENLCLRS